MTPAKANRLRALRIEGKQLSNLERRKRDDEIRLIQNIWTVNKLWNEFYYQKSEDSLKNLNIDAYRFNTYLSNEFGEKEPKDITVTDIDYYRNKLSKKLEPASVKQVLTLLQRIINFGVKRPLVTTLNFRIQMPKINNVKTEMLTQDQLSKLLKVLNEEPGIQAADIMKMALFTGMRKSEIFSLQCD